MRLREHQTEFEQKVDRILAGEDIREIYLHATPGAGKSTIPIQACKLIKAGLADRIAWVVPRLTLGYQAESNFIDPFFREMFGHSYQIRASTNEVNPCRGTIGFVTTYQAIGIDNRLTVLRELDERKYILVLDEFHHCELNGTWHKALKDIVNKAVFKIFMTGTLARGDDKRIAYVPYQELPRKNFEPCFRGRELIRYSRSAAMQERAILPLKFFLHDGTIEYENEEGEIIKGDLSKQYKNTGDAIYTALETKFAEDLLLRGLQHWQDYRKNHPRSKLMVVCADIAHTKKVQKLLEKYGFFAKIATSDDSKAVDVIKEFKHRSLNLLVSVAMVYEGFDCKPLTHVIFLTHIRSIPWIEQVIARAARIDAGPYHSQAGFIFAPDDPLFRSVVEQIKKEQYLAAKGNDEVQTDTEITDLIKGEGGQKVPRVKALNGTLHGSREFNLGEIPTGYIPSLTVSEQEQILRNKIEKHVNKFAYDNRYKPQKINTEIKTRFRKARNLMELSELDACLKYVQEMYPLNGKINGYTGVSQARTRRRRVPTKAVPWR